MSATFASTGDLGEKNVTFAELGNGAYAYTAEGDPNTGVIVGDDGVMVIDTQATPAMANDVLRHIREVTDKPIKFILLSHYHAVRVLGASAYNAENIIASRLTYELIAERGQQDYDSEYGRFPRLFDDVESIPGLTWPSIVFDGRMTVDLGNRKVSRRAAVIPRATRSPGCPTRISSMPAIWSNMAPRPIPATPIWRTGRRRWMRCAR
jgi:glyoxylase-like metal-dependent hydrolase (beta-lactamase superfamily II)